MSHYKELLGWTVVKRMFGRNHGQRGGVQIDSDWKHLSGYVQFVFSFLDEIGRDSKVFVLDISQTDLKRMKFDCKEETNLTA